jgi:hypothetical protein
MADLFTFSTLNTFPISDRFHIHAALTHALATVSALPLIHLNSQNGNPGEQRINCSERTEKTAKTTINKTGAYQKQQKHQYFPVKEHTCRRP